MNKCSRKTCGDPLHGPGKTGRFFRIWNNPSEFPAYRDYCFQCGCDIIEFNIDADSMQLPYLIMLPPFLTEDKDD